MMNEQTVTRYLTDGFTLATLPETFKRLEEISKDTRSDIDDVVAVVKTDSQLAASLLRLANSPFYSSGLGISTIEEAAQKLGLQTILESSLALGMVKAIEIDSRYFDINAYWRRSLSIAYTAEIAYEFASPEFKAKIDPKSTFTAGLLHDLGMLVLMQGFPEETMEVVDKAIADKTSLPETEKLCFGFTHQQVGRTLFEKWQLPRQLQAVAGFHHNPEVLGDARLRPLVDLICIADYVCSKRALIANPINLRPVLCESAWQDAGIGLEKLIEIMERAEEAAGTVDLLLCA